MTPPPARPETLGRLLAAALTGAWRPSPPPSTLSDGELTRVEARLRSTGAAGLAWRRLRAPLQGTEAGRRLHETYREQFFAGARQQRDVAAAFDRLRAAGIEPILGKGWGLARLYPEAGLRPSGDIDLYVPVRQHGAAVRAARDCGGIVVDLHRGFAELDDRDESELYARSLTLAVADGTARIFGPEDHARLVALHALRHGLIRPLWLCDVALAAEVLAPTFDWSYFASGSSRRTSWTLLAFDVAREILGARHVDVPRGPGRHPLPAWLVPSVIGEWGRGRAPHGARTPMADLVSQPARFSRELLRRWPNGVEATVGVRGSFNAWPRLPYQLAYGLRRAGRFAIALARSKP